jgi:hypothetical protein
MQTLLLEIIEKGTPTAFAIVLWFMLMAERKDRKASDAALYENSTALVELSAKTEMALTSIKQSDDEVKSKLDIVLRFIERLRD